MNEREKSQKDSFDKYSSSFQTKVLGANVPQGQTPQSLARSWIDETQKSNALMMVSDFEFAGLDSLFDPGMLTYLNQGLQRENLKSMSSKELKSLQSVVRQAIMNQCEARGLTCSGPTADIPPPKAARVAPVPQDQLSVFGTSNGGSPFQLSGDVGKLFGKSGVQTADIYVSRVQVWTQKMEVDVITGLRVFYKNSQGLERPTPVAGLDTGTLCEIEISPIEKVGSIDIRSGSWIDYMEIRGEKGTSFGACGNKSGGGLSSIVFNGDETFNGFFGQAGLRVDMLGVQKAHVVSYLT